MSTQVLILIIAAVGVASAVGGFALSRAVEGRKLRRLADARDRLNSTLATVPGGYITWNEEQSPSVSDGLADLLPDDAHGVEGFLEMFGDSDRVRLVRLMDGLRSRGEEFSLTLLTIDAGRALRIDGRRARRSPIDVLWVADVTNETAIQSDTAIQLTAAQVERDGYRAMMASVFALNRERARAKEQKLVLDCPPDIGEMYADERRLKQVLFNLVSNAITFTPETGVVTVGARRTDTNLEFRVEDTGVGIHEDEQERVFEKFERGNSPRSRQLGAGLGLSLVRSFVELHGGDVVIESEPERGTAIVCRLPLGSVEADPAVEPA